MNEILTPNDAPKPSQSTEARVKSTSGTKPAPLATQNSIDVAELWHQRNRLPNNQTNGQPCEPGGPQTCATLERMSLECTFEPAMPSCSMNGLPNECHAGTPTPAHKSTTLLAASQEGSEEPEEARRHVGDSWKLSDRRERPSRAQVIKKKFAQFDGQSLSSAPAPDVKIGQRVAYKEYYGNEFGTIRWIGRVPQISADWTVGVEFDNAIGEGDGSLHGRRYFIAKDCFAKFLPLANVALVEQHVGRPEPGTMISVMSAAVRPGQMISIQRVSTVHVQHCFLNAPHRRPGAEFLAVNTRLHCQCPNCGPCAHVVKPPRTQRLRTPKNATHMCQFSTYTCCGMESSEDALCTYTGNKISSLPPPGARQNSLSLPPISGSWIEGAGYLSTLQAEQRKLMPEEYRMGAAPDDVLPAGRGARRNSAGRPHHRPHHQHGREPHGRAAPCEPNDAPPPGHRSSAQSRHSERHHHKHRRKDRHRRHHHHHQPPPVYANIAPPEVDPRSALEMASGQAELRAALGESLALAVGPGDRATGAHFAGAQEAPLKATRSVYRDSIENHYLFPSDEAEADADPDTIDSTLEQDFEELSLARYGYLRNPARKHTRSCSSSGNSRNLLVRSLRSLVSCLSAHKSGSELEASCESANTMRIVGRRPLSGGATPVNKSRPMLLAGRAQSPAARSWRSRSSGSSSSCSHSCSSATSSRRRQRFYEPVGTHRLQLLDGRASQEVAAPLVQAIEPRAGGQPLRRQVSSSSDCGFSSASQNSAANLVAGSSPPTSSQLDELERLRVGAIYERLAARLLRSSSSSSPVTSEDLLKLRTSLFERRAQSARCGTGSQLDCCEHLLAELIKNSLLNQRPDCADTKQQPQQPQQQHQRVTPDLPAPREIDSSRPDDGAGGARSPGALPRAFELKLRLSINENAKRRLQDDAGALAAATNAAPETTLVSAHATQERAGVEFSLVAPAAQPG